MGKTTELRRAIKRSFWFRQDRGLLQRFWKGLRLRSPDEVVSDLIALFPEVEAYWNNGTIGKHVTVLTIGRSTRSADIHRG